MKLPLIATALLLTACTTTSDPGIRVEIQEVVREVARPCPGVKPERPTPLERPLPTNLEALSALLAAKLTEWAGEGKYGDAADKLLTRCLAPVE